MAKLTQKTFFEALEVAAKKSRFRVDCYGHIRRQRTGECPLCAVCKLLTKKKFVNSHVSEAAQQIGLPQKVTDIIVAAADNADEHCYTKKDISRIRRMRKRLLQSVGLA